MVGIEILGAGEQFEGSSWNWTEVQDGCVCG